MALFLAAGAEERHTASSRAVAGWNVVAGVLIDTASQPYTGNASFSWKSPAGSSPKSTYGSKCWWSFASVPWVRGNGTWYMLFQILVDNTSVTRSIGWYYNTGDSKYYLALFSTGGTRLVTATNGTLGGGTPIPFKLEFDDDAWTCWADMNLDGTWASEFTYTDTTSAPYTFQAHPAVSTDDTKATVWPFVDDVCAWDSDGNNWNSRIATMADFPRISVAHYPTADNSASGLEWQDLDEVTPDHSQSAGETKAGYLATIEDLKTTPQDYTAETIQAVMVTHVAGASADPDTISIYNVKENGTEYLDSAYERSTVDRTKNVQIGSESVTLWATYAGYYPWTPEGNSWTETNFNACEFGISLIDGKSDQLTVQVIYFGTAHEWSPPVASTFVPRVIMC